MTVALPERFNSVAQLEECLSQPTPEVAADLARVAGDILVLGVAGKMGPTLARMAKRGSKTFLRCAGKVEEGATRYARAKNCSAVCCGHTHYAAAREQGAVAYYNSGGWTELPCNYLTVADGCVRLHRYDWQPAEEVEAVPQLAGAPSSWPGPWECRRRRARSAGPTG